MQMGEEILCDPVVVERIGVREQVVADADGLLRLKKAMVVVLENLARGLATLVGLHRNRCAV